MGRLFSITVLGCAMAGLGCGGSGAASNEPVPIPPGQEHRPPTSGAPPAPASDADPGAPDSPAEPGVGQAGSGAMPIDVPIEPVAPGEVATGISTTPVPQSDPDIECYEFHAHAKGNTQPLFVGIANDAYHEVDFDPPWNETVYVKSFRALIDNSAVIHHWLFYRGGANDGNRALQAGWAPGGSDTYFSDDLGMELPVEPYSIQYHYNSNDASAVDASGVEVCVTPNRPANVATVSWLGTDAIFGASAQGLCDPMTNERVHILAATPHMHKKGVRFEVVINRAAGGTDIVHDEPFDFAYQQQYVYDVWLEPGDTITTKCTYNGPSSFGPGTDQEMCYWFPIHYPANSLVDAGPFGKALHGPNSCLGL
jgi:hypothetical protein